MVTKHLKYARIKTCSNLIVLISKRVRMPLVHSRDLGSLRSNSDGATTIANQIVLLSTPLCSHLTPQSARVRNSRPICGQASKFVTMGSSKFLVDPHPKQPSAVPCVNFWVVAQHSASASEFFFLSGPGLQMVFAI